MHRPATVVLQFWDFFVGFGLLLGLFFFFSPRTQLTCTTSLIEMLFKQPPLPSCLLPLSHHTCSQIAQVAEAAMARAFSMAPILIHPEHLSPSLPIGERQMGGVRAWPISSQWAPPTQLSQPEQGCRQAANFTPAKHHSACHRSQGWALGFSPPATQMPLLLRAICLW